MIDLSHLTEEEQGVIMTVLRRDIELKKAEEERVRKLEKILDGSSQSDTELKYRTGEWFYEAKSRRHMDKIHGSEIILASMKQRKSGLEGSPRIERSKTPSSHGSDINAPPKPARSLVSLQQELNDEEKENLNSAVRSPRMPRHNPFNRASLIVEPPDENDDMSNGWDQETPETDPISPLKSHPAEASQTSRGSLTSEGSSVGFRPVPKKRTFLSRHTSSQSESSGMALDSQEGSAGIVPAPRLSLQRGSSESSNQSCLKGQDEIPQKRVSDQVFQSQSQFSSNSSLERERKPPSRTRDRAATYSRSDVSTDREIPPNSDKTDDWTPGEDTALNAVVLHTGSIQDINGGNNSSMGTSVRQGELSLPQSTVDPDPPISYDLNFIDNSDVQIQKKSNQKHAFQLSTQTTSPTGDEDSIAKVLDWFSRSTDSLDWPKTDDSLKGKNISDKHIDIGKIRGEDSFQKNTRNIISDRKNEPLEIRRDYLQKQTYEAKELKETQEGVKTDARERMQSQEVKDDNIESQQHQISDLKSFWEKSNMGPKVLVSKSIKPSDKGQKPVHLSAEEDKEKVDNPHRAPDVPTVPGIYNGKGIYDKTASDPWDEREQKNTEKTNDNQDIHSLVINTSTQRNNNNSRCNSDYLKLAASPQEVDRSGSEAESLCVTGLSSQMITPVQFEPHPDSISQTRETSLQDELSETITVSQLDTDRDSEKLYLSRNSPYMDYKTQMHRGLSEDAKMRDGDDKSILSSPKQKEDMSNKDRIGSPRSDRQGLPHQESATEKIKQLKTFWEQERKKSVFYTGKPKAPGDGQVAHGVSQAKLTKRYTKSEYDLTLTGNYSGTDEGDSEPHSFTVLPLNQRIEKLSPSLSTNRTQFNTLRDFWGEATSDAKVSSAFNKPKSPKRNEPIRSQLSSPELKIGDSISEKTRPVAMKSSPPVQNPSRSPNDIPTGSRASNDGKNNALTYTAESRRNSRDSNREENSKSPSSSGKEIRPQKSRKDSFSYSSSRGNSLRRASSMFSLCFPDENELKMDVSPIYSQSRKQRQNAEKGASLRRSPEESETVTPRARACVPRDYRHYLGMTDDNSVLTSLTPAVEDEGSEAKPRYDFDLGGPVRTSTPVFPEERYNRRVGKTSQRPLRAYNSSSDAGQESSVSSTSDSWSNSRSSSNRGNVGESQNLVRKALRRAEARPKMMAKSMEDLTASLSPRQERRQDPTADMRRITDASSIPSPSPSLCSDPEHLKKMSKSVPSFLQKEDDGRDSDSTCEYTDYPGRLMMGSSFYNLTGSSGMASLSSLSGSVMTMYSADFGNVEVQGNIQFSINYIHRLREFHIFVAKCQDLAAVDQKRGRSDPYVKSYLSPDKGNLGKRKTSVKKKTLNPTFNEILRYRVRMEYLRTQTLILSVWHHDTFGRNSFLGEVDIDLSKWDFDRTQMNYFALKSRTAPTLAPSHGRGEMRLALRFLPQTIRSEGLQHPNTGEIHIWVKECKNLPLIRAAIDPYVKCFVLPDTSRKSRQKTRVLRRTADPGFNHTMVYDGIRQADLSEACVELTVWDRDRLASTLLGGLRIGSGTGRSYGALVEWMDSTSYETALWERMIGAPNEWVEDILPLRMLNSAKTTSK